MTNGLLVDKKGILQDVIGLAENWKSLMDRSGFDGGSIQEIQEFHKSPKGKEIDEAEQKLSDYMSSLSFDDVKMIQTVMYLGRDEDYDKSLSSVEIYNDFLKYLGRNGWNTKEIEVNQITEKTPLASYLKDGLKVLNVTI